MSIEVVYQKLHNPTWWPSIVRTAGHYDVMFNYFTAWVSPMFFCLFVCFSFSVKVGKRPLVLLASAGSKLNLTLLFPDESHKV